MKNMSNEDIFAASSGQEGSASTVPPSGTQGGQTGGNEGASQGQDFKALYEELEKKLGTQGDELGGYKKFFQNIEPLLNKLDTQPELIQAILAGKVDSKLATAAVEGKVSFSDAAIVSQAHTQVKEELGKKEYNTMNAEEIEKMVAEKANEIISGRMNEASELNDFNQRSMNFINTTHDFDKYADEVTAWLKDHPDQDDIKVAYFAVKGEKLDEMLRSGNAEAMAEVAKELAMNATGGGPNGGQSLPNMANLADSLIARRSNPNDL